MAVVEKAVAKFPKGVLEGFLKARAVGHGSRTEDMEGRSK